MPGSAKSTAVAAMQVRPTGRRLSLLLLAGLLAMTALAYRPALDGPFVFDDVENVARNPLIRDLKWVLAPGSAAESGATPYVIGTFHTRYVAFLTFALDYRLQGPEPRGFHRTNLAIHLVATLLVAAFVRRLLSLPGFARSRLAGRADLVALIAAAIFGLHPLQTQAVSYVVQRMASLAALLGLAAALAYLRARTTSRRLASLGWCALCVAALGAAMLTKQNALTFPFLIALVEIGFLGEVPGRRRVTAPILATLVLLPALTLWRASGSSSPIEFLTRSLHGGSAEAPISYRNFVLTQPPVLVGYLRLFVWPTGQSIDHAVELARSLAEPRVSLAILALVALLALAVHLWRLGARGEPGWRLTAFGLFWFFVALAVEGGLFPIQDLMVEHRLYMPLVGLAIALGAAAGSCPSPAARRTGLALLASTVLPLFMATRARNQVWTDELALWRDAERGNPHSPRVLFNVGETLVERGRIDEGEVYLRRALAEKPDFAPALANLGTIAASRGDLAAAELLLARAFAAEPDNWIAAVNLGDLALFRRDRVAARRYYEAAIRAASWEAVPRQKLAALDRIEAAAKAR